MSDQSALAVINDALNPFMHQVTGSTPASIRDMIKASNVRSNATLGVKLATIALFAASVNKSTLEGFVAASSMADVRSVLSDKFSISGKVNMSALSLMGHCLLTSDFLDNVEYARAFRDRMGLKHIWERDLNKDRLSDEQYKIFSDKKRKVPESEAKALGKGYFKYIGVDKAAMGRSEREFWDLRQTKAVPQAPASGSLTSAPISSDDPFASPSASPPRSAQPRKLSYTIGESQVAQVDERAVRYFKGTISEDEAELIARLEKYGVEGFESRMLKALAADPEMKKRPAGSTVA